MIPASLIKPRVPPRISSCSKASFAFLVLLPLLSFSPLWADSQSEKSAASWGSMDIGVQGVGWQSNAEAAYPDNGWELLTPLTLAVNPWKGGKIYAQSEYAAGNYTDSVEGPETIALRNFSDTVVGLETDLKIFNVPSLLNLGFNIPTGNPAWETLQSRSSVPNEFIDNDYRGRGFGTNFLYGISLPAGQVQYGVAAGYMYAGAFNPYYGQVGNPVEQLKLGDSAFLSMNRVAEHGGGESDILRLSAFYFLPTQVNSSNLLQMGPNLNASYAWLNPGGFSVDMGVMYFLPNETAINGQLVPDSNGSMGTRFYLNPSYTFGDFTLLARSKYILANDYPASDALYDGGGLLLGLQPSLRLKLDSSSRFLISAGFDYVLWQNGAYDALGNRVNVEYGHLTFGTHYEVDL